MQTNLPDLNAIVMISLSPVTLTGISMRLACLYTTARLFINCPNETKWEISSEVRKVFFDPCSLLHFARSRLDLWPIPLHRATTAGCGDIKKTFAQIPMQIYSADGELIAQYGEKRRIPVTLDQIPPEMVKAFIATEDSRFTSITALTRWGSSVRQVWRCSPATRHKGQVPLPSSWRETLL